MRPRVYPLAGWVVSITDQSSGRVTPGTLSVECHDKLRKLANIFEATDHEAEVLLKRELYDRNDRQYNTTLTADSREQQRADLQALFDRKKKNGSYENIHDILNTVRSLEYLQFWTAAWSYANDKCKYYVVKGLLRLWREALLNLDSISGDLMSSGSDELQSAYSAAVVKVQSFEGLAMRALSLDPKFSFPESDAISNLLREDIQKRIDDSPKVVAEMIKTQASLTAITFIVTVGASALSGVAWKFDTSSPGTIEELDFWTLIQSTVMQLLSLFTAIYPIYRGSSEPPWIWALLLATAGAICSIASIPVFLYFCPFWSSVVSFFGIAAQAVVILQLSLLAIQPSAKPRIKQD